MLKICKLQKNFMANLKNLAKSINSCIEGSIKVNEKELNLNLTLCGGQSFRWECTVDKENKNKPGWHGVAYNNYWILTQDPNYLHYKVYAGPGEASLKSEYYDDLLRSYFRLDFDLFNHIQQWRKAHTHFDELSGHLKAVRILDQQPLENILSFICSQNNNIKRITTMIQWLCSNYGEFLGHYNNKDVYSFPTLESLVKANYELEPALRAAKFGYRAKFIAKSIEKIHELGGLEWFEKLRQLSYEQARNELVQLPGIGYKVADCICLMSLNHLESVPIDTHIFKLAKIIYMPKELASTKAVTPKIYEDIARHFREVYGQYAGWAQAVLFCSELQQFQTESSSSSCTRPNMPNQPQKRKKGNK